MSYENLIDHIPCIKSGIYYWQNSWTRLSKMSGVHSLRNELQEFVLENVEMFSEERVLGTGSYGSVQEVKSYYDI